MNRMITIIVLMGLAACGGSGAGSGTPPPASLSSAPGESALVNYLQGAHQYTLSATDSSGTNYTV